MRLLSLSRASAGEEEVVPSLTRGRRACKGVPKCGTVEGERVCALSFWNVGECDADARICPRLPCVHQTSVWLITLVRIGVLLVAIFVSSFVVVVASRLARCDVSCGSNGRARGLERPNA